MGETLAQKIIGRATGRAVSVGEVVTARVDLAMIHDSGGPRRVEPILSELGAPLWDRDKVVLISDHFVPGDTDEGAQLSLALTAKQFDDACLFLGAREVERYSTLRARRSEEAVSIAEEAHRVQPTHPVLAGNRVLQDLRL